MRRRRGCFLALALLLAACNHDYGSGGYVDDGSFKRPPTPIPAIPVEDER